MQVLRAPPSNSFSAYSALKDAYRSFRAGDVVVLCGGVLGRLLVAEWVELRPSTTFLELGSFFTPALGDVGMQLYHRDGRWRPACSTQRDDGLNKDVFAPMRQCLLRNYAPVDRV